MLLESLPVVRSFVASRLRDGSAVEDVVQNVFVAIHRARQPQPTDRRVESWRVGRARHHGYR
ncbi:MAG: hypothetical protein HRU01_03595 [Myxococcales bacterium]|nr:hypothetical protein [Myxococcales bacterium]